MLSAGDCDDGYVLISFMGGGTPQPASPNTKPHEELTAATEEMKNEASTDALTQIFSQ